MNKKNTLLKEYPFTVRSAIGWGMKYLEACGFENAGVEVEFLLSSLLNRKRCDLYLEMDKVIDGKTVIKFKSAIKKRARHIPLDYIIKRTEFMGLTFEIDKDIFIPRPETEMLVEKTVQLYNKYKLKTPVILDVGTGCGNIAISLAKYILDATIYAIDINEKALTVAHKNVKFHKVENRVIVLKKNMYTPLEFLYKKVDFIVSNPPYIKERDFSFIQPEILKEPTSALYGGKRGIDFYKPIIFYSKSYLKPKGFIILEISPELKDKILEISNFEGFNSFEILKDYQDLDRVIIIKKKGFKFSPSFSFNV